MDSCTTAVTNTPLPAGKLTDFNTVKDFAPEVRDGKVLLILLATECGSCQNEVQIISESPVLLDQKVKIFGVARENKIKVQEFARRFNLNIPVLIDEKGELFSQLQVKCTPTNLLVKDGIIENVLIGSPKDSETLAKDLNSF